ncbi:hypothetical protein [Acinetobacter lanii]|uniref:Lipoprotein n=1 Tax=Acinetobacter lanii TaxID=2715163 RepID=A0A6G8S7M2_9GAMM|nr:hypothetical protein [Acinetobacter lanii]QIO10130.1 hypothetical protein G8D99_14705 [Acinetobacter lanii]
MKKLLQGMLIPFTLFSFIIVVMGCDPSLSNKVEDESSQQDRTQTERDAQDADGLDSEFQVDQESQVDDTDAKHDSSLAQQRNTSELKSGNVFYIARDVASMQMNAGDYVSEIQQSQENLQHAVDSKDQQQLQTTATALQKQLQGFNQALINLDLKSEEIHHIRENVVAANTQVLKSPLMNGDLDFSKVDFNKLQQQMSSVQNEMLKLAAMVIPKSNSDSSQENESN